jgi:hypothetical protein
MGKLGLPSKEFDVLLECTVSSSMCLKWDPTNSGSLIVPSGNLSPQANGNLTYIMEKIPISNFIEL